MIFATQIHPHDVRDEGAVAVARNISELAACPVVGGRDINPRREASIPTRGVAA